MSDFVLEMFPAADGDLLVLTWGTAPARHLMVDFGRKASFRAARARLKQLAHLELLVLSHVDADHVEGALAFAKDKPPAFTAREVWFNARAALLEARARSNNRELAGAVQGEEFERAIKTLGWPINPGWSDGVVSINSRAPTEPIRLEGGLEIHLLSPDDNALTKLLPVWDTEIAAFERKQARKKVELDEGRERMAATRRPDVERLAALRFNPDDGEANGSSIAFLARYGGRSVLLAADAHPEQLAESLRQLDGGRPVPVDLTKLSHHGSKRNTSPELLKALNCRRYAISTDGSRHDHPDAEAIARLLTSTREQKTLYFNARHEQAAVWHDPKLEADWNYQCVFPDVEQAPIRILI